jgi:hypothetical protein
MTNLQLVDKSLQTAQYILSQRFQGPIELVAGEQLKGSNRSHVMRCHIIQGPADAPSSVIVKRVLDSGNEKYDPNASTGPAVSLFDEWAGLQLLGECFGSDSPVPDFFGGDRQTGIIVMEDLGQGKGLDTLLRGDNPTTAAEAFIELFKVIGRMHAVTIGKEDRYRQLRRALGTPQPGYLSLMGQHAHSFQSTLELLKLEVPPMLNAEIMRIVQQVVDPGPFHAFIHCDPCPDNCLVTEQGMRLLDFEMSQFGLALWDGAYARGHFPTCWCVNRIPTALVEEVESAYRVELVKGCPQAAEDALFGHAVVAGCACAVFLTLSWEMPALMSEDNQWGIATNRQRVLARLDALAQATERWACFPTLGAAALYMNEALRALWLPSMEEMPLYPAFKPAQ